MRNNFAPNQTLEGIFKNRLWRFMVRLGEKGHCPNEGKRPLCQHVGKNGAQALSSSSTGPEAYSAWRVECGGRDRQVIWVVSCMLQYASGTCGWNILSPPALYSTAWRTTTHKAPWVLKLLSSISNGQVALTYITMSELNLQAWRMFVMHITTSTVSLPEI